MAVAGGYAVQGLSRNDSTDAKLKNLGALRVRGDLTSLDVLKRESLNADVVIHLASAYNMSKPSYDAVWHIDKVALDTLATSLESTDKPLVVISGTLITAADPAGAETTEDSPLDPHPINTRGQHDFHALTYADRGVRVMVARFAPFVYGRGGSGVKLLIDMAAQPGGVTCVDGGNSRTTTVHVDDAARLCLLVAQKGQKGEVYNVSSATDVTFRQISEAIAETLQVPVRDISFTDAKANLGEMLAVFLSAENRASGAKAVRELGWQPRAVGILEDIKEGSYVAVAEALRKGK